jgi:hypothetical protein
MATPSAFPDHSGLMPANLITFVHLSMFSAMNLANWSGEFGGTVTALHCRLLQLRQTGILSSLVPISSFTELPIFAEQ